MEGDNPTAGRPFAALGAADASDATFRQLLDTAPDAIVVVDADGRIALVNKQTERVFGYDRSALLGLVVEVLVPERFRGSHVGHRTRFVSTPKIRPMGSGLELFGRKRDGSEFPIEVSISPLETAQGMLISKRLSELMHGRVGFESVEGKGSQFWIELPIHAAAAAPSVAPAARAGTRGDALTGTDGPKYTIVYIEDNPSSIALVQALLADFDRVELLTAPTAEIGIELVRARQPSVVLMDINLPGISGFEATRRLRDWPETKHIPVVALSAAAMVRDSAKVKEAGFYRYLTKPVKIDELAGVLEELLIPADLGVVPSAAQSSRLVERLRSLATPYS